VQGADVLLAADCVPFAYADFHKDFLQNKAPVETATVGALHRPEIVELGFPETKHVGLETQLRSRLADGAEGVG
jgi:hypothetical protein